VINLLMIPFLSANLVLWNCRGRSLFGDWHIAVAYWPIGIAHAYCFCFQFKQFRGGFGFWCLVCVLLLLWFTGFGVDLSTVLSAIAWWDK
jgi:hypothetical protein